MRKFISLRNIIILFTAFLTQTVYANDITVNPSCNLADAIRAANKDMAVGTCPAGNGADSIVLTADLTLVAEIPHITSDITIDGANYTISGDERFRIFYIGKHGMLSANNMKVINGKAVTGCPWVDGEGNVVTSDSYSCGGAIISLGNLSISHSEFAGNSAGEHGIGGAIMSDGELTIYDSVFIDNSAVSGGAISSRGDVTITGSAFSGNSAENGGGAIEISGRGELTTSDSAFTNNSAQSGGAITTDFFGQHNVFNSVFADNIAEGRGGAINTSSSLTISGSAFTGNTAKYGGAIASLGELAISDSTFIENSASRNSDEYIQFGGAIQSSGTTTLTHVTIARNSAERGGGLFMGPILTKGELNLRNSIIALNNGGDCHGVLNQDIGNLIQDGSCRAANAGNPSFGELVEPADGSPAYLPLAIGSMAIDAAHLAYCTETDQRGVERPQGEACDIGAIEYVFDD